MENHFKGFTIEYIERNKNNEADDLAKATTRNTPMLTDVFSRYWKMPRSKQLSQSPS
jgi:hypothetical protein